MNLHIITFLPILLLTGIASVQSAETRFLVQGVEDGDTLVIRIRGGSERIQLFGIDAPEVVENPKLKRDLERTGLSKAALLAIGQKSTRHLQGLITSGDAVRLEGDLRKRDKYGRISVRVIAPDGSSLNDAMVSNGYAIVLNRFPLTELLKSRLLGYQQEAIRTHRGLWGSDRKTALTWSGLAP
jgi:micrococcal nuclease